MHQQNKIRSALNQTTRPSSTRLPSTLFPNATCPSQRNSSSCSPRTLCRPTPHMVPLVLPARSASDSSCPKHSLNYDFAMPNLSDLSCIVPSSRSPHSPPHTVLHIYLFKCLYLPPYFPRLSPLLPYRRVTRLYRHHCLPCPRIHPPYMYYMTNQTIYDHTLRLFGPYMTKICNNPFRRFPGHRQLYRDIRSCFARIVLDLQLRPVLQLPLVCTIYACTGYANSPPESL